jgi:hypothetical protein
LRGLHLIGQDAFTALWNEERQRAASTLPFGLFYVVIGAAG